MLVSPGAVRGPPGVVEGLPDGWVPTVGADAAEHGQGDRAGVSDQRSVGSGGRRTLAVGRPTVFKSSQTRRLFGLKLRACPSVEASIESAQAQTPNADTMGAACC